MKKFAAQFPAGNKNIIQKNMPIENSEEINNAKRASSVYGGSLKILGEGGIDPEEAYQIIEKLHEEFHGRVKPGIIEQAAERALDESKGVKGIDILKVFQNEVFRIRREINKSLKSEPDKKERVIYRGLGSVDLKEWSNN